jgi:hypothetical protein
LYQKGQAANLKLWSNKKTPGDLRGAGQLVHLNYSDIGNLLQLFHYMLEKRGAENRRKTTG